MPFDRPPLCPNCGTQLRLGRRIPPFLTQPELQNFDCRPCGIVVTEAARRADTTDTVVPHRLSA